jgi:serine protease Do
MMKNMMFAILAFLLLPVELPAQSARAIQDEFAAVAEKSTPAVVVVRTGRHINRRVRTGDTYEDLYNYYYGQEQVRRQLVPTGQGSGFFVNADGYILTNYHIVKEQDYFRVTLYDGREFDAALAGEDPLSDLALLRIDAAGEKFPYLTFADSDKVKPGHWAIAIGAPFNLSYTVTVGVVSFNRRTVGMNPHENFIQADVSINPGNSGGPLLDIDGKVIGVNDFILSPQGGNIGLSFAIAGNLAQRIYEDLINYGKVERSWVGIGMAELPAAVKKEYKLTHGVVLNQLYRNSPAHQGGLRTGDIILEVDGQKVQQLNMVRLQILSRRPNEKIKFLIRRDGRDMEFIITASVMPNQAG